MGQKIILTCDLHNDNTEAVDTLRFTVGGETLEVELCEKHLREFNDKVAPFVDAARPADGKGRAPADKKRATAARRRAARGRRPAGRNVDSGAVRAWAREAGYDISDRGRIPGAVLEAFRSASA
jgi:hypothetical protein